MKKFILIILSTIMLYSNSTFENSVSQQEAIMFLESKIKQDDYSSALELGLIYEDGILDIKGKKTPDIEKATFYYIMAYEHKDYRSVFKLVPLLAKKKKYAQSLEILQKAIDESESLSMKISAISIYGTIALDNFPNNNDILIDALTNISLIPQKELDKVPTLIFIQANLVNIVGDKKYAELLLNKACFSKNAPIQLKNLCFNSDNLIVVKDENVKSIDSCTSCQLIEKH